MPEPGIASNSVNSPARRRAPVVSIGMPVYNGDRYLREALDSLLTQTFDDFELIISDNASTDDTKEICLEYASKDSRIRYIRQDVNQGATFNFEFVLAEAFGTFFMWAAHDDTWDKNWLEVLVAGITEADMAIRGVTRVIDPKGGLVSTPAVKSFKRMQVFRVFLDNERNGKVFHIYGLFWRAKLLRVPFDISEPAPYAADVIFIFQLIQHGDLRCIEQTAQNYRDHDISAGRIQARKENSFIRLVCLAHNLDFYKFHMKAAPRQYRLLITLLVPIKMLKTQAELWLRGFMHLIFR